MERLGVCSLPKAERLHSSKTIESLFTSGKVFFHYPFKVFFNEPKNSFPEHSECSFAVVVPKRSFKRAVHRNRLKRRIREAYRKNKFIIHDALKGQSASLHFLLRYVSTEELPYTIIEQAMREVLHTLAEMAAPGTDISVPAAD